VLCVWAMNNAARALGKNGKEFTTIVSINPVPAAIKRAGLPEGFNKLGSFDIDNPNMDLFETFGNGLREKITSSPEWRARNVVQEQPVRKPTNTGSGFDDMDSDIPF